MGDVAWQLVGVAVLGAAAAWTYAKRHAMAAPHQTVARRWFAAGVDGTLFGWVGISLGQDPEHPLSMPASALAIVLLLPIAYELYCHARWGQTVGKWVFGVRVVSYWGGEPIGAWQSVKRSSPRLLVAVAMLFDLAASGAVSAHVLSANLAVTLLELVTLLVSPERRALHDYVAGTMVVRVLPMTHATAAAPG